MRQLEWKRHRDLVRALCVGAVFAAAGCDSFRDADDLLVDPHVAELSHSAPADTIEHALYPVPENRKRDLLEHLLATDDCGSAIVFTRTKHRARRLAEQLSKAGHRAVGLQGNMSQGQRDRAMQPWRRLQHAVLLHVVCGYR